MRLLKFLSSLLFLGLVTAAFFGVPFVYAVTWYQAGPAAVAAFALTPLAWLPLVVLLVLTLLFGRLFCEAMCPLGALQTVVAFLRHPRTHVRRVCTRLPETRRQRLVRWSVVALFVLLSASGFMGVAGLLEPYAIFGRALTLTVPGVLMAVAVLVLALFGRGRIWCNWICPVGTVLGLVAKVAPMGNRIGPGCGNCRRCFPSRDDETAGSKSGVERREVLKGVAVLAAAEKLTDGGFAPVSHPDAPDREVSVLPPGAGRRADFARRCIACGLCMERCPERILRPSTKLATLGQPECDFRAGYCLPTCMRCGAACPARALDQLQIETKAHVHMGFAVWKKDLCLRTTGKDACTACVRKCPRRAIHLVAGFPVVDRDACTGCGACEHVCPVRPQTAIYVKGLDMQRTVQPVSETDLVREMKALLKEGWSIVTAVNGVIAAKEKGRGIGPVLKLHDAGALAGAIVVDKIIGRAAAAVCVDGGAKQVVAEVMSEDAAAFLRAHGVACAAETMTKAIVNREGTGACPMEAATRELEDPKAMIEAIRKAMKK